MRNVALLKHFAKIPKKKPVLFMVRSKSTKPAVFRNLDRPEEAQLFITADQPPSHENVKTNNSVSKSLSVGGGRRSGSQVTNNSSSNNIPKGYVAVYVGPQQRRFLVPTKVLSKPEFRVVMDHAAEEFGYEQEGGLRIPCDEHDFELLLAACSSSTSKPKYHKSKSSHHPYV